MSSDRENQFDDFLMPDRPPANPGGVTTPIRRKDGKDQAGEAEPKSGAPLQSTKHQASQEAPEAGVSESHAGEQTVASETGIGLAWGLVLVLGLIVIVQGALLLSRANTPTPKQDVSSQANPIPAANRAEPVDQAATSWQGKEQQLMSEIEEARAQIARERTQHQAQIKAKDSAYDELASEFDDLGDQNRSLVKQLEELKRSSAVVPQPQKEPRKEPEKTQPLYERTFMVRGLREGDSLNVRTGPDTSYPVVDRLYNGSTIKVIGPGVSNGGDNWVPCSAKYRFEKGWVNSFFLHEISRP